MVAMLLEIAGKPLKQVEIDKPIPREGEILIKISYCGVCRTDLHIVDGDLKDGRLPIIPGHEIIGEVEKCGEGVNRFSVGDTVGVPWLAYTCGHCKFCRRDQENLCENARFTGYTVNGGYAQYIVAHSEYCFPIPAKYYNANGAPLLCAGLIGYRSYRKTDPKKVENLGLYGFGASAHILAQLAIYEGKTVYAFTREGDTNGQKFAKDLGCHWAGSSTDLPPQKLDAAIVFAPAGPLMVQALKAVDKGCPVVSAGIYMSPIPQFDYQLLWGERSLHSVANLERKDGHDFLRIAAQAHIKTTVQTYALEEANRALDDLKNGRLQGAAVLEI